MFFIGALAVLPEPDTLERMAELERGESLFMELWEPDKMLARDCALSVLSEATDFSIFTSEEVCELPI